MVNILYFLEDRAQEGFIKALVNRIAQDLSIPESSLKHDFRSARGGSTVITEYKRFIKDTNSLNTSDVDLLVVAIDGNCKGHNDRVKELKKIGRGHPLLNKTAYAVPDPHIERWYIMDQRAFKRGVGIDRAPNKPQYKCEKDYYKRLLREAFAQANITSFLGGPEYAESIVANMASIDTLRKENAGYRKLR